VHQVQAKTIWKIGLVLLGALVVWLVIWTVIIGATSGGGGG
jgi:hypothetical protein